MKILLFTDCLGAGGAQRQLVGLATMLKEIGYNVKVCTYHNFDFYKKQLDDAGVPNELIPGADNSKKRILAVRNYFKREQPDWIIAYQETPSLVACAAKILGCKYRLIVSERNTTQTIGMNERVRFFLYHWADAIVPNSYAQERFLINYHPWMGSKLKTITNFVDLDKFVYSEHARRRVPIIMIAASIWPSKNTPGLIEAAKILKDRGVKCIFQWYGLVEKWMMYFKECEAKVKEYGLQDMVELLPKTKEIQRKYQEADYFCLPSFYEGTPNVICEAISTGVPVMCSNVCDNPHYVIDGRNGVLFDPMNPKDIADKIEKILSQTDEEYQTYRKMSRTIAEEKLSQNIFIDKYLKLLESKE